MSDKIIRGLAPDVVQELNKQGLQKAMPETKSGQRRPGSNAIIVHAASLRALGLPLCFQVEEVEYLALQIAQRQRKQETMRDLGSIRMRLAQNFEKLERCAPDWCKYRIASVVYYLAQQFLYDYDVIGFKRSLQHLAEKYSIPGELLMLLCLAKFRDRATRDEKDIPQEEVAIDYCVATFYRSRKLLAKPLD